MAFCLLIFLLSLAGVFLPLAGFFGKFYIFISALDIADHFALLWLVLLALAMSVVSFYYYLRVLKQAYVGLNRSPEPESSACPSKFTGITLWATAVLVVVLGLFAGFADESDCGRTPLCISLSWLPDRIGERLTRGILAAKAGLSPDRKDLGDGVVVSHSSQKTA